MGLGGNKIRKLDFLLGAALSDGAEVVITFGALQSNHARQTAAACAMLGLECHLILTRMVRRSDDLYEASGNLLLDRLFGARVHFSDDPVSTFTEVAERLSDRVVSVIPAGGSDVIGTLGYVSATDEWAGQARRARIGFDRVVVATSTGGTYAGTLVGLKRSGLTARATGVCVYADIDHTRAAIEPLIAGAAAELGIGPPPPSAIDLTEEFLGEGYGIPTDAMIDAIAMFARIEGLALDPVYSGKAAAALVELVRRGEIGSDERVLFIHTGGSPGLFAYGTEIVKPGA